MNLLLITFIVLLLSIVNSKDLTYYNLEKRKDLYFNGTSNIPFTGSTKGLIQGSFVNGKKEGKHIKYYENGNTLSQSNFKKGIPDGEWLEFHYNGNLLSKRNYNNGILEGLYIDYYRIGQILSIRTYKNNKLMASI